MTLQNATLRVTASIIVTAALAVSCARPTVGASSGETPTAEPITSLPAPTTSSSTVATSTASSPDATVTGESSGSTANSTSATTMSVIGNGFNAVAHRLAKEVKFNHMITLSPPDITDVPVLSAQATYDKMMSEGDLPESEFKDKVVDVQLSRFTNSETGDIQPDGSVKPFWINKLVWTFSYHEIREYQGAPPAAGQAPRPAYVWDTRILIVADPTTGRELMEEDN